MKKILILGGGFGGVEFYRTLHKKLHGAPQVLFRVVSRTNYFLFYPMLHEVATGSVERTHVTQPLREIVNCCVEQFTQAEITHIDFDARAVETSAGRISYDYLVVALGVRANYFGTPGASEHCVTLKSIQDAVTVRNRIIQHFEKATREHDAATRRTLLSFTIIGGGPTGVELAGQVADLLFHELGDLYPEIDSAEITVTLIESADRLLKQFDPEVSALALARMRTMGVTVLRGVRVTSCGADKICFDSGAPLVSGFHVWTAGTQSLVTDLVDAKYVAPRGGLRVRQTLQLVDHPEVFAIGDNMEIVDPADVPLPQTAQVATAAARHAARNLYWLIREQPLEHFQFKSKGDIMPIGDWFAVAQIGSFVFSGRLAWMLRRVVFIQRVWSPLNRIKIAFDWMLHMVLPRDTSEL